MIVCKSELEYEQHDE